jgi:hypothetical protein
MCCKGKRRSGSLSTLSVVSFFASLYRISPRIVNALVIVKPETVLRWHRVGLAACVREFSAARFQFRHALAHAFGIFDLEGDEAVATMDSGRNLQRRPEAARGIQLFSEQIVKHPQAGLLDGTSRLQRCVDQGKTEKRDTWIIVDVRRHAPTAERPDKDGRENGFVPWSHMLPPVAGVVMLASFTCQ